MFLDFDYSLVWLVAASGVLVAAMVLVIRNWRGYSLPIKLIPLDVLTVILLIDLNIKSSHSLTVQDPFLKMEAIAFTGLLAFVLFAPVVSRAALGPGKRRTR